MKQSTLPTPTLPETMQVVVNGAAVTAVHRANGWVFHGIVTENRQLKIKLPDDWPVGMMVDTIVRCSDGPTLKI